MRTELDPTRRLPAFEIHLGDRLLADRLCECPRTAEELASLVGADADGVHRALRAAATVGLVRLDPGGRFHATRLTKPLRSTDTSAVGDWCRYLGSASVQAAWGDQDPNRAHPRFSMIDLQMLAVTEGGRERSSTQLQRLLDEAGLLPGPVRHTPTGLALIEGTAPAAD